MEVASTPVGDVVVLKPSGDLKRRADIAGAFWAQLHKGKSKFVVSLEEIYEINTVGILTLLEFKRLSEAAGGGIMICSVSERLKKVFEAAKMREVFSFADDEEIALASFIGGLPVLSADSSISRHRN